MKEEGQARSTFFLVRADQLYAVSEGDVIDNAYRVEGIEGGRLVLTYLPLDIRQSMSIPAGGS